MSAHVETSADLAPDARASSSCSSAGGDMGAPREAPPPRPRAEALRMSFVWMTEILQAISPDTVADIWQEATGLPEDLQSVVRLVAMLRLDHMEARIGDDLRSLQVQYLAVRTARERMPMDGLGGGRGKPA